MRKTVVYLACPMRIGHWSNNVRKAATIGRQLMDAGYAVINPMGSWLLDLAVPTKFEDWIECDYGLIAVSDCVLRIEGESEGADLEVERADGIGKDVFLDVKVLFRDMPTEQDD